MSQTLPIVLMDEVPDCPDVISEFLGEGEGFAHQPTASLTERVIQPFDQARLSTGFVEGAPAFEGVRAAPPTIGLRFRFLICFRRSIIPLRLLTPSL
jgi:hypothetical protein